MDGTTPGIPTARTQCFQQHHPSHLKHDLNRVNPPLINASTSLYGRTCDNCLRTSWTRSRVEEVLGADDGENHAAVRRMYPRPGAEPDRSAVPLRRGATGRALARRHANLGVRRRSAGVRRPDRRPADPRAGGRYTRARMRAAPPRARIEGMRTMNSTCRSTTSRLVFENVLVVIHVP